MMLVRIAKVAACTTLSLGLAGAALSHPGGLNGEGCHNNRKTGNYHWHDRGSRQKVSSSSDSRPQGFTGGGGGSFRQRSAARAAGAAPVRAGSPRYGRHLDRDGDGVGCE